jgi:hypothetical protein
MVGVVAADDSNRKHQHGNGGLGAIHGEDVSLQSVPRPAALSYRDVTSTIAGARCFGVVFS